MEKIQRQIADAMVMQKSRDIYWKSGAAYYGVYGGCHVFFMQGQIVAGSVQTVGRYTFEQEYGGAPWVYQDGKVFELSEAYTQKLLTDQQLEAIYNDHQKRPAPVFKTEGGDLAAAKEHLKPVSEDRLEQINAIWKQKYGEVAEWDGTSGYYGTYGDCVVIHEGGILAAVRCVQVADYLFRDSAVYSFMVYTGEEQMEIRLAYEKGLLRYEDIGLLYTYHLNQTGA